MKPDCAPELNESVIFTSAIHRAVTRRANPDSSGWAYDDLSAHTVGVTEPNPISTRGSARRKRDRAFLRDGGSVSQRLCHQRFRISLNGVTARTLKIRQLEADVFRGGAHLDTVDLGLDLPRGVV